eukprot:scaffold1484_cov241-Pinguiococcus_pyrenoidosus.AAC.23
MRGAARQGRGYHASDAIRESIRRLDAHRGLVGILEAAEVDAVDEVTARDLDYGFGANGDAKWRQRRDDWQALHGDGHVNILDRRLLLEVLNRDAEIGSEASQRPLITGQHHFVQRPIDSAGVSRERHESLPVCIRNTERFIKPDALVVWNRHDGCWSLGAGDIQLHAEQIMRLPCVNILHRHILELQSRRRERQVHRTWRGPRHRPQRLQLGQRQRPSVHEDLVQYRAQATAAEVSLSDSSDGESDAADAALSNHRDALRIHHQSHLPRRFVKDGSHEGPSASRRRKRHAARAGGCAKRPVQVSGGVGQQHHRTTRGTLVEEKASLIRLRSHLFALVQPNPGAERQRRRRHAIHPVVQHHTAVALEGHRRAGHGAAGLLNSHSRRARPGERKH